MDLVFSFQKVFKVIQIHLNPSLAELGADATLESLRNHLTDVVAGHPHPPCLRFCLQFVTFCTLTNTMYLELSLMSP